MTQKTFRLRDIYLTYIDTTVKAKNEDEARRIAACITRDHSQIDDNKMFQQEEIEEVGDDETPTFLSNSDKRMITNALGYQIYEGILPEPEKE